MITIKEIADMMNVSPTTVSNVIHGRTSKVSKENVEKIQKALNEFNYIPKMGLEVLTKGKTRLIIVTIHTTKRYPKTPISDPFYGQIIGVLEAEIRKQGYYMMLHTESDVDNIFKTAMSWNVAGIIAITLSFKNFEKLRSLVNCPVVGIDTYRDDNGPLTAGSHVILDDVGAGRQMTDFLVKSGFENIMVIADAKLGSSADRMQGVRQVLEQKKLLGKKPWYLLLDTKLEKQKLQLNALFPLAGQNYVLFCTSDQLAFFIIGYLNEHGFKVPDDFSVCGFDDNSYAEFSTPKLTTMHQDIRQKGEIAAQLLFKILSGEPEKDINVCLPVELVPRQSVVFPKK